MNVHTMSFKNCCEVLGGELLWLHPVLLEDVDFHECEARQAKNHVFTTVSARLVLVEHDDYGSLRSEMRPNKVLLRSRHRAAHEGDNFVISELVDLHASEEALYDDERLVRHCLDCAVEVEKLQRFVESGRELVLWSRLSW